MTPPTVTGPPSPPTIRCSRCKQHKLETEFNINRRAASGRNPYCKPCAREYMAAWRANNRDRLKGYDRAYKARLTPEQLAAKSEYGKRRYESDPLSVRDGYLRRTFGISLAEYDRMYAEQGGKCFICGGVCPTGKTLAVDHCHATGRVRALLCSQCNNGLGRFQDRPDLLLAAAAYIQQFQDREEEAS
jgi:hypothetical protein